MTGCGGVQEQVNNKGRGTMLQGSFPVQTAQLEYKVHEPYLLPHLQWKLDVTFWAFFPLVLH